MILYNNDTDKICIKSKVNDKCNILTGLNEAKCKLMGRM